MHIETERLILKPHTMDNLQLLNKWDNDPELLYFNDDRPEPFESEPLDETKAWLETVVSGKRKNVRHFAIHKKDGALIGYGMIAFIDSYNHRCKFGITIGNKEEWGKGFGKEVLRAVVDYCFRTLHMNRIGAEVYDINERSIQLFENIGFKREGIVRQNVVKNGRFIDEFIYGLLRSEWEAINEKPEDS